MELQHKLRSQGTQLVFAFLQVSQSLRRKMLSRPWNFKEVCRRCVLGVGSEKEGAVYFQNTPLESSSVLVRRGRHVTPLAGPPPFEGNSLIGSHSLCRSACWANWANWASSSSVMVWVETSIALRIVWLHVHNLCFYFLFQRERHWVLRGLCCSVIQCTQLQVTESGLHKERI